MLNKDIVAVIDVGSNSIKLLVAQKGFGNSPIESVYSQTHETRISKGIGKLTPVLSEEAITTGGQSISDLVSTARGYDSKIIKIVATSAVRDATNGLEFAEYVKEATGIRLDVLSGSEEATLIGRGLRCDPRIAELEHFLQMDIGGGSLELIRLSRDSIEAACSLQLGAVRLTEKFVLDRTSAIAPETEAKIRNHVLNSIADSSFSFEPIADPMIVTGGAFFVIRSILADQSGGKIENASPVIYGNDIAKLKKTLCDLSLEKRKAIHGLPTERADIMPAALITIDTILKHSGRDTVTQSHYNLRYGIAAELLAEP